MAKFQSPTGMHDLLGEDLEYFQKIEKACKEVAGFYGFQRIETPILEETGLFEKGTGFTTDIVQKQMFSFRTRGGDFLTLRPEGTPGVVRSYIQHGMQSLSKPVKLWYFGPFFRYERPQAERFRQFYQFGFESLGIEDPVVDAQIIQIFYNILEELGFKDLTIEINSIGDSECRPEYKRVLTKYLKSNQSSLCPDCRRRLKENPLRILDCKREKCQIVAGAAPQMIDRLCKGCHNHFKSVLEFLEELELPYQLNPYLVRGLDYYTRTVFEIFSGSLEDDKELSQEIKKTALVGGGRYDDLVRLLKGKDTPACGAAAGIERIIHLMKLKGRKIQSSKPPQIFLDQVGELPKRKNLKIFEEFKKNKIKLAEAFHKDSLTSQLRMADRLAVKFVLILGQKEALEEKIIIREMKSGKQKIVPIKNVIREMKRRLKKD
jgi:histidyl-tRNA synthetase